jgi:7-carboxy-7-deazaguanine synthase
MKYPVSDIFYSIQGEGFWTGTPMAFIRLAGCSVTQCSIRKECDEAPWKAKMGMLSEEQIVSMIDRRASIVCITGGEPTDHDLLPLLAVLDDYKIHIETSGVRRLNDLAFDWVTVSPKSIRFEQRTGDALKLVIRPEWTFDDVDTYLAVAGSGFTHVYLQPLWGVNHTQVLEMVKQRAGLRLSTQSHKYWEVK